MICSCGGHCSLRENVNAKADACLKTWVCTACGRRSPDILKVKGEIVARGPQAARAYEDVMSCAKPRRKPQRRAACRAGKAD